MSSKRTVAPLTIRLAPSKSLRHFNLFIHLMALSANWLAPLPWYLQIILTLAIVYDSRLNNQRLAHENRSIDFCENLGWRIGREDEFIKVKILPSSVVTTWLIFLHTEELAPILITRDMLAGEDFRRLCVKLTLHFAHKG